MTERQKRLQTILRARKIKNMLPIVLVIGLAVTLIQTAKSDYSDHIKQAQFNNHL